MDVKRLLSDEKPIDKSLRGKALKRATAEYLPRTLTPYEWEEYYREHGRPPEHAVEPEMDTPSWLDRLWARFR